MHRIIAAIDGSKGALQAEELAIRLALESGAAIEFVTVSQPPLSLAFTGVDTSFEANDTLDAACRCASAAGVRASGTILRGCAGEEIAGHARRRAADVIIVGPREHCLLRRLIAGSVSRSVMRVSAVPVLVAGGVPSVRDARREVAPAALGSPA